MYIQTDHAPLDGAFIRALHAPTCVTQSSGTGCLVLGVWLMLWSMSYSSPHSVSEFANVVTRSMTKVMVSSSLPSRLRMCSRLLSPSKRQMHPSCKMLATSLALQSPVWSLKIHLAGSMYFSMRTTTWRTLSTVSMSAESQFAWLSLDVWCFRFRSHLVSALLQVGSVQLWDEHDVCSLPTSSSICEEVSGRGSMLLVHAYDVAFLAWSLFCTESTVVSVMCSISFSADLHAQP